MKRNMKFTFRLSSLFPYCFKVGVTLFFNDGVLISVGFGFWIVDLGFFLLTRSSFPEPERVRNAEN